MRNLNITRIVESFPAYDVVEIEPHYDGYLRLFDGDLISVGSGPQSTRKMGSVVSYALNNGDCPIEAYERAIQNGHDTHYVMNLGSCLSASEQAKETRIYVEEGQKIRFEGRLFEVVIQHKNAAIKPV